MTDQHPITPPPELAAKWLAEIYDHPAPFRSTPSITLELVERAAQWGADQELEACCDWMSECTVGCPNELRAARRPPASLKKQALRAAHIEVDPQGKNGSLIIRALEDSND